MGMWRSPSGVLMATWSCVAQMSTSRSPPVSAAVGSSSQMWSSLGMGCPRSEQRGKAPLKQIGTLMGDWQLTSCLAWAAACSMSVMWVLSVRPWPHAQCSFAIILPSQGDKCEARVLAMQGHAAGADV